MKKRPHAPSLNPKLLKFLLNEKGRLSLLATFCCLSAITILPSCGSSALLSKKEYKSLHQQLTQSPVFSSIFTGFALYDPVGKEFLYQKESDKYYTPASNTKLFTFYAALNILEDELPVLNYGFNGDSLIFWGTGNPLFLHPDFDQSHYGLKLLQSGPGDIDAKGVFYTDDHYHDQRFGPGWAWGDYPYYYQAEKAALPLYGNVVRFVQNDSTLLNIHPSHFEKNMLDTFSRKSFFLGRREAGNLFLIDSTRLDGQQIERDIPFRHHKELVTELLSDALGRKVAYIASIPEGVMIKEQLTYPLPDTLYKRLLKDSDNFIAEQLMLMISDQLFGEMNTARAIEYVQDSLLSVLPQRPVWRDGSGLSRYNLMTPESIVKLLELIYQKVDTERLLSLLPVGGRSGTIRNWYGGPEPYVYAKTGTLNGKHCLSGYIKTHSGKMLIFSFMNNNYINGSTPVKEEMQRILEWIRDTL